MSYDSLSEPPGEGGVLTEPLERRTYTVRESAQLLGIGRDAMYAAVAAGLVPTIRHGRRAVIPRHVINRILTSGESLVIPSQG